MLRAGRGVYIHCPLEEPSVTSLEIVLCLHRRIVGNNNRNLTWEHALESLDCPMY